MLSESFFIRHNVCMRDLKNTPLLFYASVDGEEYWGQRSSDYASTQRSARFAELASSRGPDQLLTAYENNVQA
jgi:hypothetical protein